jgi:hypothetical protein
MASIPLPALDIKPPQQPDMLGDVSKLMALRNMMNQGQAQQQEMQLRQQQLQDEQATTAAMRTVNPADPKYKNNSDGYYSDLTQAVLGNGGSANAATAIQQHGLTIKKTVSDIAKQDAETGLKVLDTYINKHKEIGDALEGIVNVPDEQLHAKAASTVQDLAKNGLMDPGTAQQALAQIQQTSDPKTLREQIDVFARGMMGAKATADQAKAQADAAKTTTETVLNQNKIDVINAWKQNPQQVLAQVDSIVPPNGDNAALNARTKSQVQFALGNGDVEGAKAAIKQAADQVGAIEKETNPAVQAAKLHLATMEKAAEQAIADGDPKAAAQLLVFGAVAPSQLISSRKPAFAQAAFTAAQQMQPNWNAQKADADYKVASSPTNVAFFGSAKSLTDKGGTLDQLADAAKDIPGNQIPVFNSISDAMKASVGSGPVAKYASILLGVADDYSKVMGGGQGSDTSRTQALSLIPAKASPEARAAAIEGIRGAVSSQINSRIGSNTVLQRMYGGKVSVKAPDGVTYEFADQDAADTFKKRAGIK